MNVRTIGMAMLLAIAANPADSQPIQVKPGRAGEFQQFVGTWQSKKESDFSSRSFDNTVLVVMPNGGAMFKHCTKHVVGSTSSVSGTVLADTVVGSIGDGELTLTKASLPNVREQVFALDSPPYRENGQWYMVLDGTVLRKLGAYETSDNATWECP
jgi:hypothetical protein